MKITLIILAALLAITCSAWLGLRGKTSQADSSPAPKTIEQPKDEEVVFAECSNRDIAGMGELMKWAMIGGRGKYKWVEARGKKCDAETLQIIAHTTPKDPKRIVANGMD